MVWRRAKITNSYTLESSFQGSDFGPNAGYVVVFWVCSCVCDKYTPEDGRFVAPLSCDIQYFAIPNLTLCSTIVRSLSYSFRFEAWAKPLVSADVDRGEVVSSLKHRAAVVCLYAAGSCLSDQRFV